jgi:hypothetical protein
MQVEIQRGFSDEGGELLRTLPVQRSLGGTHLKLRGISYA